MLVPSVIRWPTPKKRKDKKQKETEKKTRKQVARLLRCQISKNETIRLHIRRSHGLLLLVVMMVSR